MRIYGMQAKNKGLEVDAAEIRIRAERRLGEMLGQSDLHAGGRPKKTGRQSRPVSDESDGGATTPSSSTRASPKLSDVGISKDLSARAQKIAGVTPRFVEYSGDNLLAFVRSVNLHRRHMTPGQQAVIVASMQDWEKANSKGGDRKSDQSATLHFDSVADRAAQSGASERTQKAADKVVKADPELAKQVGRGEISLPAAVAQVEAKAPKKPAKVKKAKESVGTTTATALEKHDESPGPVTATKPGQSIDAAVREYGESMTEGAKLPPVTVFFDGTDHWLADGFHRVQASMDIGALSIDAEIRPGDQRAARLYSVGANAAHGLRRTNDDKRRAVNVLLDDAEWKAWSDRRIADVCGVSVSFVSALRRPEVAEKQADAKTKSAAKKANSAAPEYPTKPKGCSPTTPQTYAEEPETPSAATTATPLEKHDEEPGPVVVEKPADTGEVERLKSELEAAGEFVSEQASNMQTLLDEVTELRKVCEADDKLAAAASVIKQKTAENRVLREQLNGAMATTIEESERRKARLAEPEEVNTRRRSAYTRRKLHTIVAMMLQQ